MLKTLGKFVVCEEHQKNGRRLAGLSIHDQPQRLGPNDIGARCFFCVREPETTLNEALHALMGVRTPCETGCTHVIAPGWTALGIANVVGKSARRSAPAKGDEA